MGVAEEQSGRGAEWQRSSVIQQVVRITRTPEHLNTEHLNTEYRIPRSHPSAGLPISSTTAAMRACLATPLWLWIPPEASYPSSRKEAVSSSSMLSSPQI